MQQIKQHLKIAILSIYIVLTIGCTVKGVPASNQKTLSGLLKSCKINVLDNSFRKEYNCGTYIFTAKKTTILIDSNPDNTLIISPLNCTSNIKIFDRYDSPTGRRKLLIFDLLEKKVFLSEWFDDTASGDSVNVQTINLKSETFEVYKPEDKKSPYTVKFMMLKTWK